MLGIDLDTVRFAEPEYLWLLIAPGVLLVGWVWQLAARRRDARRFRQHRRLPVRERFPIFGSLVFWLCLILAVRAATILALARPTAAASLVRTAGIDLVILQDGSASMRTRRRRRQPLAARRCASCARSASRWPGATTAWRWRCSRTSPRRRCG